MPISDEMKEKVKLRLVGCDSVKGGRGVGHTAAAGVVLYNDGYYGEPVTGFSGSSFPKKCCIVVQNHRNAEKTGGAKNDAEVVVLNKLAGEIMAWWKEKQGIQPSEIYLYIYGPKDMCPACKKLKHKFSKSFDVTIEKEYRATSR